MVGNDGAHITPICVGIEPPFGQGRGAFFKVIRAANLPLRLERVKCDPRTI